MCIYNGPQWKDSLFKIDVIIFANYYNHLQNYLDKVFKFVHSALTNFHLELQFWLLCTIEPELRCLAT